MQERPAFLFPFVDLITPLVTHQGSLLPRANSRAEGSKARPYEPNSRLTAFQRMQVRSPDAKSAL